MNQNEWAYANGISSTICQRCDASGRDGFKEATEDTVVMDFNEYQKLAQQTAIYTDPMYLVTSLMIEAAEAADLFVKLLLRGDDVEIDKVKVVSELGDVLWNLANMAADQGLKLEDIAIFNVEKLKSRQARGVIKGSGGDR
jgi:NTP pyrophosphatase (non-canonical NTP hydrolase)